VDDLALARALATGDEAAFHCLVDQQTTAVFRICYRVLGRVDEAEDAVQETFVLAYRTLATYRGDGPPGAWLARIAVRECWRRARSSTRQRAATTALDDTLEATLADPTDPAHEAIAAEEREEVRRRLAELDHEIERADEAAEEAEEKATRAAARYADAQEALDAVRPL
jgi:RNA polymerase sigma-70 factor (ECF subfamily)